MRSQGDSVLLWPGRRTTPKAAPPAQKAAGTVQPRYKPPEAWQKNGFITLLFLKLLLTLAALFNCYKIPYSAIISLRKKHLRNTCIVVSTAGGEKEYDRKYLPCPQLDENPGWTFLKHETGILMMRLCHSAPLAHV